MQSEGAGLVFQVSRQALSTSAGSPSTLERRPPILAPESELLGAKVLSVDVEEARQVGKYKRLDVRAGHLPLERNGLGQQHALAVVEVLAPVDALDRVDGRLDDHHRAVLEHAHQRHERRRPRELAERRGRLHAHCLVLLVEERDERVVRLGDRRLRRVAPSGVGADAAVGVVVVVAPEEVANHLARDGAHAVGPGAAALDKAASLTKALEHSSRVLPAAERRRRAALQQLRPHAQLFRRKRLLGLARPASLGRHGGLLLRGRAEQAEEQRLERLLALQLVQHACDCRAHLRLLTRVVEPLEQLGQRLHRAQLPGREHRRVADAARPIRDGRHHGAHARRVAQLAQRVHGMNLQSAAAKRQRGCVRKMREVKSAEKMVSRSSRGDGKGNSAG
eukprot:6190543-Pleurochrysis_carterae.AAC.1